MISPSEALDRLREGNERFVAQRSRESNPTTEREKQASPQAPFATILSCSDSRVPPEQVFDVGIGDLFVVRVAGNLAAETQIASVEFAAAEFGVPLVVVLGHSRCGAVLATLEQLRQTKKSPPPGHLGAILDRVRPALTEIDMSEQAEPSSSVVAKAVRLNVEASVDRLCSDSPILRELIDQERLRVVAAVCSLETGAVEFWDQSG